MTLDYQQLREQVTTLGEMAPGREQARKELRELAEKLLHENAQEITAVAEKVRQAGA